MRSHRRDKRLRKTKEQVKKRYKKGGETCEVLATTVKSGHLAGDLQHRSATESHS